jgi:hypothetical protein
LIDRKILTGLAGICNIKIYTFVYMDRIKRGILTWQKPAIHPKKKFNTNSTHARTHARTHAHTHARTHARTHTHTPGKNGKMTNADSVNTIPQRMAYVAEPYFATIPASSLSRCMINCECTDVSEFSAALRTK